MKIKTRPRDGDPAEDKKWQVPKDFWMISLAYVKFLLEVILDIIVLFIDQFSKFCGIF